MAISAISGFDPVISLISSVSPLRQISLLQPTSGLSGLLALASTQTSISSLGRLLNDVEALQTAATALTVPGVFVARNASVVNTAIATASAGAATPTGSFTLQVNQLAQAQTITTTAQASSLSTIGSGAPTTLSFAFAGGSERSVELGADNTLAGIANAINAAGIGVSAQLVSGADGVRLALTGPSGAGNAFTIAVDGDAAVAGLLAFAGGGSGPALTREARDAQGTVNGIAFSASTNSVNTAIAGLSLNLAGTGTTTLTVAANRDAAAAVERFADAFNTVQRGFAELAGSAVLAPAALIFSAQLSAAVDGAALAQVGITTGFDGTLGFNSAAFQAALNADQQAVAGVFRNGGSGLAEQVAAQAAGPLSPEQLLPVLTPALAFAGTLNAGTQDSLLLSLFAQQDTASSLGNQLLLASLLGAGQSSGVESAASLVDLMLAEVLFANPS